MPSDTKVCKPRQLFRVLVDAIGIELAQPLHDLVELFGIDVLLAQHVAQRLAFLGPAARFAAELADVIRSEVVAVGAAITGAATALTEAAGRIPVAVSTALPPC